MIMMLYDIAFLLDDLERQREPRAESESPDRRTAPARGSSY
jgi:hypothetical protein